MLLYLVIGVGGFFLGSAATGHGNLGPVGLQLTYGRDALDIVFALGFLLVGFTFSLHLGRWVTGGLGLLLLALGIIGAVGRILSIASISFIDTSWPMAIFSFVTGILAVLAALGTLEEGAA